MHTIPTDLLQAIASYLETRPFREVAGLIMAMQEKCAPVPPPTPKDSGEV